MSDQEDRTRHEGDDDSDIRALMRESDYQGRLRDEFRRELLRELNHNFRYHPMRSRILLVAVMVLFIGVATWRATDVGSDGFTLHTTGSRVGEDPVVEAPTTGTRLNAPIMDGSVQEGAGVAQDIYEQISANAAKVIRLEI